MGKGTTSLLSRRCRHGLEIKRLSGSGHFLFSFAGLCRYGGRISAKTHFGAFYGLSTVVFSVKLRILRGSHSENNGFMLSEEVSPHGGYALGGGFAARRQKTNSLRAFSAECRRPLWRQDAGGFGCDTEDEGSAVIFVCVCLCAMMSARFCEQGFICSLTMRFMIRLVGLRLTRSRTGFAECLSARNTRSGARVSRKTHSGAFYGVGIAFFAVFLPVRLRRMVWKNGSFFVGKLFELGSA